MADEIGETELWTAISTFGWIVGAVGSSALLWIMFIRPRIESEME